MYYCNDCESEFEKYRKVCERHSLDSPPYEILYVCPFCSSTDFTEISATHCRSCGAKLLSAGEKYCSAECETRGNILKRKLNKKLEYQLNDPVYKIAREIESYNKKNKTNLSYGKYVAFIEKKGAKKCKKN